MDIHLKFNTVNNNDGLGETKEIHFNGRVVSVINPKHMGMSVICSRIYDLLFSFKMCCIVMLFEKSLYAKLACAS